MMTLLAILAGFMIFSFGLVLAWALMDPPDDYMR